MKRPLYKCTGPSVLCRIRQMSSVLEAIGLFGYLNSGLEASL